MLQIDTFFGEIHLVQVSHEAPFGRMSTVMP